MAIKKIVNSSQLDADLASVADAIREKSGGSASLAFPSGFVSTIQSIPSGGGETVYISSTGLLYTPTFTIDVTMENTTKGGSDLVTILNRYGVMEELVDLTLTGIMRNTSARVISGTDGTFSVSKYPKLKKLSIKPTEIRTSTGVVIDPTAANYNQIKFGHYVFSESNLQELTIGQVGGPYFSGGGYYRNKTESGVSKYTIGSTDGLSLKVFAASYLTNGGFGNGAVADNTTITEYDYTTGEVITA